MLEPVLEAINLTISLDGKTLISALSLTLSRSDRLLLTAERGDALSGLAHALCGLIPSPWRKTIIAEVGDLGLDLVEFEPPIFFSQVSFDELRIPPRTLLVPEDLDTWFIAGTGHDELAFFGWIEGSDKSLDEQLFSIIDRALLSRPISGLSGGQKQRLALAEVLVAQPQSVFLLNSIGWLDRQHRAAAIEILVNLDCPIVFCDEHTGLLSAYCNRHLHITASGAWSERQIAPEPRPPEGQPRKDVLNAVRVADTQEVKLPAASQVVISAQNLEFIHADFEDVHVFDGTTFAIPHVRDILLLGANGTGKSTFASLVCGLEGHYNGVLSIWDARIGFESPERVRKKLGVSAPQMLFQFVDDNFIRASVAPYLCFGIRDTNTPAIKDVVSYLDRNDIQMADNIANLDTFRKKLLVLARVVISSCQLAFLDEPFWALTDKEQSILQGFVDDFLGNAIRVWITHEPECLRIVPGATARIVDGQVSVN